MARLKNSRINPPSSIHPSEHHYKYVCWISETLGILGDINGLIRKVKNITPSCMYPKFYNFYTDALNFGAFRALLISCLLVTSGTILRRLYTFFLFIHRASNFNPAASHRDTTKDTALQKNFPKLIYINCVFLLIKMRQ